MTCSLADCAARHFARTWCKKHYTRWLRHGDPRFTKNTEEGTPLLDRLTQQIDVGDCWEWTGRTHSAGYGLLAFNQKEVYAHRAIWECLVGPIDEGLTIDHLCRNRKCVNPDHLEPVPEAVNLLRGEGPPAHNARKKACNRGHVYTTESTYVVPTTGHRHCRLCRAIREGRSTSRGAGFSSSSRPGEFTKDRP